MQRSMHRTECNVQHSTMHARTRTRTSWSSLVRLRRTLRLAHSGRCAITAVPVQTWPTEPGRTLRHFKVRPLQLVLPLRRKTDAAVPLQRVIIVARLLCLEYAAP